MNDSSSNADVHDDSGQEWFRTSSHNSFTFKVHMSQLISHTNCIPFNVIPGNDRGWIHLINDSHSLALQINANSQNFGLRENYTNKLAQFRRLQSLIDRSPSQTD
jgi:hypothetical protein